MQRPAALWKSLTPAQRLDGARAFWEDEDSLPQQVDAVGLIARQRHLRPQTAASLPVDQKARALSALNAASGLTDALAARLLVVYHLAYQRPLLKDFLDRLGIAHEEGIISDEDLKAPDAARLAEAAAQLAEAHPPQDVRLYFATLVNQDPDTWGALEPLLQEANA